MIRQMLGNFSSRGAGGNIRIYSLNKNLLRTYFYQPCVKHYGYRVHSPALMELEFCWTLGEAGNTHTHTSECDKINVEGGTGSFRWWWW